jgi:hypothetical protein
MDPSCPYLPLPILKRALTPEIRTLNDCVDIERLKLCGKNTPVLDGLLNIETLNIDYIILEQYLGIVISHSDVAFDRVQALDDVLKIHPMVLTKVICSWTESEDVDQDEELKGGKLAIHHCIESIWHKGDFQERFNLLHAILVSERSCAFATTKAGHTPLFLLCQQNPVCRKCLNMILYVAPQTVSVPSRNGHLPLHELMTPRFGLGLGIEPAPLTVDPNIVAIVFLHDIRAALVRVIDSRLVYSFTEGRVGRMSRVHYRWSPLSRAEKENLFWFERLWKQFTRETGIYHLVQKPLDPYPIQSVARLALSCMRRSSTETFITTY